MYMYNDNIKEILFKLPRTTEFEKFCNDPMFLNFGSDTNKTDGPFKLHVNELDADDWIMASASVLFDIHLYMSCKINNPYNLFTTSGVPSLTITFCAGTDRRAHDLFNAFICVMEKSPWFQNLHEKLEALEASIDKTLYRHLPNFLHYVFNGILIYYMSKDVSKLRGHTRLTAILDTYEFNYTECEIMLERSLLTVRSKSKKLIDNHTIVPQGRLIFI